MRGRGRAKVAARGVGSLAEALGAARHFDLVGHLGRRLRVALALTLEAARGLGGGARLFTKRLHLGAHLRPDDGSLHLGARARRAQRVGRRRRGWLGRLRLLVVLLLTHGGREGVLAGGMLRRWEERALRGGPRSLSADVAKADTAAGARHCEWQCEVRRGGASRGSTFPSVQR